MKNAYERLSMVEFGKQLLRTGDLDPVYVALNNAGFDEPQKLRWLVAYAGFYSCAAACWMSERTGAEFWNAMMVAAQNHEPTPVSGRWPRGQERRHFRGAAAERGIADWQRRHTKPETMFTYIAGGAPSFRDVVNRAREHVSIGEWLAFKVVDLVDACLNGQVDQSSNIKPFLYETPKAALLEFYGTLENRSPDDSPSNAPKAIDAVLAYLDKAFASDEIPHKLGQPVDMFCIETIACKWGSHMSGHYPLWNDIDEITHGLGRWTEVCESARRFLAAMPKRVPAAAPLVPGAARTSGALIAAEQQPLLF